MPRHIARSLRGGTLVGVALAAGACVGGLTDPLLSSTVVEAIAVPGMPFIESPPFGLDADDLIACPIEVRLASSSDASVTLTRVRLETRRLADETVRTEREWLEGRALTRWFDRELAAFATDTSRIGLAGPRPFDWDLEIFFEVAGRRGEGSRWVSGRCGPAIPGEGAAPVVELVEVIGGGPGAVAGDTIEVAYRVTAAAGLWSVTESAYFLTPVDTAPPRTFPDGPITLDRRRRYLLQDRAGVPLDWTLFVRARDLRESASVGELRVAW